MWQMRTLMRRRWKRDKRATMFRALFFLAGVLVLNGCGRAGGGAHATGESGVATTNVQTFQVKGVIKSLAADGKTVEVRHEEVTNYMPAMTMEFEAKTPNELRGLKAGDAVTFRLNVTDQTSWIDQVRKLGGGNPMELPSRSTIRLVRDVEPLEVGDRLPEYHFTNE